ncbi:restriction endonuclease subunit S [Pseudomonas sediminis]|uniref:restriction endonuclease subunit S n=1 Tax=Pseudomonas sediminis TaxID=1691904 RepID=UPI0031CC90E5
MNQAWPLKRAPESETPAPSGWKTGELLSFLELQRGVDLPVQDRTQGDIPIFGSNGLLGFHNINVTEGPGVITGRSGTIGKLFYTEDKYWPLNTTLYVKNFKGNLPKFAFYKLSEIGLEKFKTGTGVPTLNRNVAHKEIVVFPPLPEQQKIAAILTAVDDKLNVIARQIEATQALKQGLMQTLFSRGVGTQDANGGWTPHTEFKGSKLGEIPSAWVVTTVGEVCEVKGGKRLPKGETLTEENTGHPYIRVTDMFMGGVDTAGILYVPSHVRPTIARYTISKDDIFISVAGTLGLVGIVPEELDGANLTENADKLTDIKINRDYLFYCLCSDAIQDLIAREATSNAQPKLALTRIREFSFPLPSDEEQARIATILASVDGKLRLLSTKRENYSSLKRGLMQKLLTGEWRVKLDSPTGIA